MPDRRDEENLEDAEITTQQAADLLYREVDDARRKRAAGEHAMTDLFAPEELRDRVSGRTPRR